MSPNRPGTALASPRLSRLATRSAEPVPETDERCELCGAPLPADHRHVLDLSSRELACACRACSLLMDGPAAGGGHFRLIPDRRLRLESFALSDLEWEELRIPVEMAFFFHSSAQQRVVAFYPSPMGATESRLELPAWQAIEAANPVLATMAPDVESLLVNRARGQRSHWLVPVEDPYRLVALIRTRWRGFTGGQEVWAAIDDFFGQLARRAKTFTQPVAGPPAERSQTCPR